MSYNLIQALKLNTMEEFTKLIDKDNSGVNQLNREGSSVIHQAAINDKKEAIEILLSKRWNINLVDKLGCTPLIRAVINGHMELVVKLIKSGANKEIKDRTGKTALYWAVARGYIDIAGELITQGADIDTSNKDGWTLIHKAASEGNNQMLSSLIEKGADINRQTKYKLSALHLAVTGDKTETVEMLLKYKANTGLKDKEGNSALHLATLKSHEQLVEKLLIDSNINDQNELGDTALHIAIQKGEIEIAKKLLAKGADTTKENKKGQTAIHLALIYTNNEIFKELIEAGADPKLKTRAGWEPVHYAAKSGNLELFKQLINESNINIQNGLGQTPLFIAIENKHIEIVKELLKKEVNLDIQIQDKDGLSLMHYAVKYSSIPIIKEILAKQINIDAKTVEGSTALHFAAKLGNIDIINELLAKGANPNIKDNSNQTFLKLIKQASNEKVTWKQYIKSFFTRINEYKDYNNSKDYIYAYNLANKRINNKAESKFVKTLEYFVRDGSDYEAVKEVDLQNIYSGLDLKNIISSVLDKVKILKEGKPIKFHLKDLPYILLYGREKAKYMHFAKELCLETSKNKDYSLEKSKLIAKKTKEILDNQKSQKTQSTTYSQNSLEDTNFNAYRMTDWISYLQSFYKNIPEYEVYNKVKSHRDNYYKAVHKTDLKKEAKIEKAFDEIVKGRDIKTSLIDQELDLSDATIALFQDKKEQLEKNEINLGYLNKILAKFCGTKYILQQVLVKEIKDILSSKIDSNSSKEHRENIILSPKDFINEAMNFLKRKDRSWLSRIIVNNMSPKER